MYDVIVVGLGGMGSAAAYHLARRGRRVLGLDRFSPPHSFGSSHGHTRIIRQAYLEGAAYVPMAQRAYELWRALEQESGRHLLAEIGGLCIGPRDCPIVEGTLTSAERYGLACELLTAADVARRFPAFRLAADEVAVFEKVAGTIFPEACIQAHLEMASRHGAELRTQEPVLSWTAGAGGVTVETGNGRYTAGHLVLAAGAWNPGLFRLGLPLEVERKVPAWFQPAAQAELFQPGRFPAFIWHYKEGLNIYGMPGFSGEGTKVAFHQGGLKGSPDELPRTATVEEIREVQEIVRQRFPLLNPDAVTLGTCLYTNTPDGHFVLGRHPEFANVALAGGFSGHGAKFFSVVGEILADLATGGTSRFDLTLFSPTRFETAR